MKILHLIFGKTIYNIYSFFIKLILTLKGIKIGKNFYCEGSIKFRNNKLNSKVYFGNNVIIAGNIEIFLRENGSIKINDNVKIDDAVRLVAANDAQICVGNSTRIGKGTIINAGKDINIGEKNLISGYCYIQSSSHQFVKNYPIIEQNHLSKKINIQDDVWLGAHAVILPGVTLSKGTILGANSVLNKDTDSYGIYAGSPALKVGERKDYN